MPRGHVVQFGTQTVPTSTTPVTVDTANITIASPDTSVFLQNNAAIYNISGTNGGSNLLYFPQFTKRQRFRNNLRVQRCNHRGNILRAAWSDFGNVDPPEVRAMQLLRKLIGQDEFRRYLKYGFVMVRGASGLRYQIGRGQHSIRVWGRTAQVDSLCCYLAGRFPPTDCVITRMLSAESDELTLWRNGNSMAGKNVTMPQLQKMAQGHKESAWLQSTA
jgi:hypothetical protein